MRGKLARQPTESLQGHSPMARTATAFTERQHGHGFYGNSYGYDERERNAGNKALVCPHCEMKLKQNSFETVLKLFFVSVLFRFCFSCISTVQTVSFTPAVLPLQSCTVLRDISLFGSGWRPKLYFLIN